MDTATKISNGGDNIGPQRIGNFTVLGKLGEGGMGAVYKAHDPKLDRTVALKLLPPHIASAPDFIARFQREAATAAKFVHPNIVQVYAADEDAGTHFIAMEFVEGLSLQKHITNTGKLDCAEALAITINTAEGLRYAWNKAHLVHRDIKPDNILISNDGEVKVADLGLAKTLQSGSTNFTQTGTVMGSPHYISPEQGRGDKDVDFRSDIYSLGCTLYHMLTGRPPFEGDNIGTLIHKHIYEPPPEIATLRPDCPANVAALVKKMMAKDRAKRFATYDELITELTAAHGALGKSETAGAAAKKRKLLTLAGAGVAVAAAVGVLVWHPWTTPVGRAVPSAPPSASGVAAPVPGRDAVPATGTSATLSKEMAVDLGGGVKMEFVLIPAGSFMMGSNKEATAKPAHKVTITKPFYLGKYEVTQEQWQEVTGDNPSLFKDAKHPVERVTWDDCQKFMTKLKDKERLLTFRLPTEAEWEYACRAGSTTDYYYGDSADQYGDFAWYDGNSGGSTRPVGQKFPNAWGLYDMHGNVSEWCQDAYHDSYEGAPADGSAWITGSGSKRVLRGASYSNTAIFLRSAGRGSCEPNLRRPSLGLRLAVESDTSPSSSTARQIPEPPKVDIPAATTNDFIITTAALPSDKQLAAVVAKLRELNPGFDGQVQPIIRNGSVVSLSFNFRYIRDLSPVRALTSLESLSNDFGGEKARPELRSPLSDLSPLKGLPLIKLFCPYTSIRDLSPLQGMKLLGLNVVGTYIDDLTPLRGIPLQHLVLHDTKVTDFSPLEDMPLKIIDFGPALIKETERNLAILRSIKTLKTIGTRPAAEFWEEVAKTAIPSKLAKEMAVELGDGVKMEFVLIPAGSFIMGAHNCTNATPHKVTITKPFYMGKYEVTQEQWEKVMGDNPSQFKGAKNPVDTVTWLDCQRFIEKWKDKVQGHAFRLPTEAEWEYACRAGSTADYYYGYDQDKLGDYAWFKDNSGEQTHPVGQKKSNAWGLYDIQGNVREWCEDWYGNYDSNEGTDPVGPSSGSIRVVRGGSWDINATLCRSSHRRYATPSSRHSYDGLRVVVEAR